MGTGRDFFTVVGVEEEGRVAPEPRAIAAEVAEVAADAVVLEVSEDSAVHAAKLPISPNTTALATLLVGFDLVNSTMCASSNPDVEVSRSQGPNSAGVRCRLSNQLFGERGRLLGCCGLPVD